MSLSLLQAAIPGAYAQQADPAVAAEATDTLPTAPVPKTPLDGQIVPGKQFTQTWSEVPRAVRYNYESYNDKQATQLRARQDTSTATKTIPYVRSGTFWWRVRAVDATGATSPWSSLQRVVIDNEAPTITPLISIGDAPVQGMATFAFESRDKHPLQIIAGVYSQSPTVTNPAVPEDSISTKEVTVVTKVTLHIDTTALPNGHATINIKAIDRAGNSSTRQVHFDVDNPTKPEPDGDPDMGPAPIHSPQDNTPGSVVPGAGSSTSSIETGTRGTSAPHAAVTMTTTAATTSHLTQPQQEQSATSQGRVLSMQTESGVTSQSSTRDQKSGQNSLWYWLPVVAIFGIATTWALAYATQSALRRK